MRKCVCGAHIKRMRVFLLFMEVNYVKATHGCATPVFRAVKTNVSLYAFLNTIVLPLRNWSATIYNTAAKSIISLMLYRIDTCDVSCL